MYIKVMHITSDKESRFSGVFSRPVDCWWFAQKHIQAKNKELQKDLQ